MFGHHVLRREQRLPGPPEAVFPFFADAGNLEAITPPWLAFRIVTRRPIDMRVGALIEYRLRLHGVPVSWLTSNRGVGSPACGSSTSSSSGPYRLWHHTHEFSPDGAGGTLMRDTVRYALPFGPSRGAGAPADRGARPRGDLRLPRRAGGARAHLTISVPSMPAAR